MLAPYNDNITTHADNTYFNNISVTKKSANTANSDPRTSSGEESMRNAASVALPTVSSPGFRSKPVLSG